MADLTNKDSWVSVEQLDYFKGKMFNALAESVEIDEDTGDIYIEYDDGTEEESNNNA